MVRLWDLEIEEFSDCLDEESYCGRREAKLGALSRDNTFLTTRIANKKTGVESYRVSNCVRIVAVIAVAVVAVVETSPMRAVAEASPGPEKCRGAGREPPGSRAFWDGAVLTESAGST